MQLPITQSYAETIGLKALAFLAATPEAINRFLTFCGTNSDDLRARAAEPQTLAALLDFLLTDDTLLKQFCKDEGIEPKAVHLAAARLGM